MRFSSPDADISFNECHEKAIVLAVLYRAILDYLYPKTIKTTNPHLVHIDKIETSAHSFLFSDNHTVDWGDYTLTVEQLLDTVDIDIKTIRRMVIEKSKNLDVKPNTTGLLEIKQCAKN